MQIEPYLMFNGRCEEAIEFYKSAVGAKVQMIMRFKESPDGCGPAGIKPGTENKIMHSALLIGDSTIMATDGSCGGDQKFEGISLSFKVPNDAEAERVFGALAKGGQVRMPLAKTFFSSKFGMLSDRFGVSWMILVAH